MKKYSTFVVSRQNYHVSESLHDSFKLSALIIHTLFASIGALLLEAFLPGWPPLTIFPFPTPDRILQTNQTRGVGPLSTLVLDQPLHHGPVAAHLAEQVIE